MTKQDLKAISAENNPAWRIVYHMNGRWKLQSFSPLAPDADRRCKQPWIDHNANMTYDDAIVALSKYAKQKGAA